MPRVVSLVSRIILTGIFLIGFTACGINTPSLGLAPGKQLVQKAISLQVNQTQQQLTQQLHSSSQKFEITQVALKQLESLFIGNLPTYHFRGTYNLKLELPQQQATQQKNPFDVYIQRQKEGKTWRLLIPQDNGKGSFKSYLIPYR
jgi:hypothetical protein